MKNRIDRTVAKYGLISPGDKVLIAFSGGADSVMLSEYLLSVKEALDLTLEAAHVEHGIRGDESIRDLEFCREYCKMHSIPLYVFRINAPDEAKAAGLSVEEYCRNRRYEFFSSIPCDKIATAHNATDNAETLIFRIARGSSLDGLCAIPPKRDKIIRPLIEISSEDIRNYLNDRAVPYCVDSTNESSAYKRNFIRNEILPKMSELNPNFISVSSRLIELLSSDADYLGRVAEQEFCNAMTGCGLDVDYLKKIPDAILGRVIALYLKNNSLPYDNFKINCIKALLLKPARFQIKDKYYAVSDKKCLRITELTDAAVGFDYEIGRISYSEYINSVKNSDKTFDFCCDYDKIVGSINVRSRAGGDSIRPEGRNCTKTLKKLFNELSVPVEKRNSIPIITDDLGIIGICGFCIDERAMITEDTNIVLTVNIFSEDKI